MAKTSVKQQISEAVKDARAKAAKRTAAATEAAKEAASKAAAKVSAYSKTEKGRRMVDQAETVAGGIASGVAEGWDKRIKNLPAGLIVGGALVVAGTLMNQRDLQSLGLGGLTAGVGTVTAEQIKKMRANSANYKK